jgi:uncharacterized membrane protein YebE (DUF533 family)
MNADRILSRILGGSAASGFAGGIAGGLASGLLTSKAGRKFGKKALKAGGVAVIGGLAYAAWSRYREQAAGASGPTPPDGVLAAETSIEHFVPPVAKVEEFEALGLTLLRAMLAAARADGKLDERERAAIREQVVSLDISQSEKSTLMMQLDRPVDIDSLVSAARTPELAAEIYTASLLAIEVDSPAERAYLAMLAARLDLPEALVASIHRELGIPGTLAPSGSAREVAA